MHNGWREQMLLLSDLDAEQPAWAAVARQVGIDAGVAYEPEDEEEVTINHYFTNFL